MAATALTLLIGYLSLANLAELPSTGLDFSDKLQHGLAYAALAGTWAWALARRAWWPYVLMACTAYGVLMEILQVTLTDYRQFDWWDALANLVGCVSGILIYHVFSK